MLLKSIKEIKEIPQNVTTPLPPQVKVEIDHEKLEAFLKSKYKS
jgi:hypothetical protein